MRVQISLNDAGGTLAGGLYIDNAGSLGEAWILCGNPIVERKRVATVGIGDLAWYTGCDDVVDDVGTLICRWSISAEPSIRYIDDLPMIYGEMSNGLLLKHDAVSGCREYKYNGARSDSMSCNVTLQVEATSIAVGSPIAMITSQGG